MSRIFLFADNVDTDQILASQYLILPSIEEMKTHAFESLRADFANDVQPGDFIVAGRNFGCGSSREQAPSVLKALGVSAVIAQSFARIFFRNAINIGLPVLECETVPGTLNDGDEATLTLTDGLLQSGTQHFECTKLPVHMQEILESGGLLSWLNAREVQ